MNKIKYLFKIMYIGALSLSGIVAFDTLVLGGRLKLIWIAVANTTSMSPFSTDGQSNYIFIGVFIIVGLLIYFLCKWLETNEVDEKDKESEVDSK